MDQWMSELKETRGVYGLAKTSPSPRSPGHPSPLRRCGRAQTSLSAPYRDKSADTPGCRACGNKTYHVVCIRYLSNLRYDWYIRHILLEIDMKYDVVFDTLLFRFITYL